MTGLEKLIAWYDDPKTVCAFPAAEIYTKAKELLAEEKAQKPLAEAGAVPASDSEVVEKIKLVRNILNKYCGAKLATLAIAKEIIEALSRHQDEDMRR